MGFSPARVVTLLTDFGLEDPFVGVMHGVVLARAREVRVVDLCHAIEPQRVAEAAFWVERCHAWFPPGTVHVVVVDPGVGSARVVLVVEHEGHLFVGPDNGVLGALAARGRAWEVGTAKLGGPPPSRTFHGRDLFAPLAAELAVGRLAPDDVGHPAPAFAPSPLRAPARTPEGWAGEVVTIDRFGNLITNLRGEHLAGVARARHSGRVLRIVGTYAEAEPGEAVALLGSFDAVEVAVREGDAARSLGGRRGDPVTLLARP